MAAAVGCGVGGVGGGLWKLQVSNVGNVLAAVGVKHCVEAEALSF